MSHFSARCEYSGHFMAATSYESSTLVLLGAPMDQTASFRPGSRGGPQSIRQVSHVLEEYSLYTGKDLNNVSFYDAGDLLLPFGNVPRSLQLVEEAVAEIIDGGRFPLMLGGEHLITLGGLRAAVRRYPRLAVVQLDAHADLRTEYMGEKYSHASVMYHAFKELGVDLYQFGIRSATAEEKSFASNNTHFCPFNVLEPLQNYLKELQGRPVYVSIDIDVVDPAYAPGTGTPEAGGITSAELLSAVSLLTQLDVVALDLVEVSPVNDLSGITALLAAKVVREAVLAFA